MEPAFQRGDILFLNNWVSAAAGPARPPARVQARLTADGGCAQVSQESPYMVGDIVVFKLAGRDIPIVHRVLKVHEKCVPRRRYPPVAPWLSPRGTPARC